MNSVNFSTPMVRGFDQNRKDSPAVYESGVAKKPRGRPPGKKKPVQGPKQVQGIIVYPFVKSILNFHILNCIFMLSSFVLL